LVGHEEGWHKGWSGGRFRIKETTADIGVVAEGPTPPAAMASAVAGMYWIISPGPVSDAGQKAEVRGTADELEVAFARALQQLVVAFDTEGLLGASATVEYQREPPAWVYIKVRGESFDLERHPQGVEIKAVTHHELVVDLDACRVEVLFDV
jgi:protein archease